jgi:hypothetical protein
VCVCVIERESVCVIERAYLCERKGKRKRESGRVSRRKKEREIKVL